MADKQEENKKGLKNYLILIVIFLIGMGLTLYLCKWYRVYDDYQKETPVIRGILLQEIKDDELEHFLVENSESVIYMCTASDPLCRNFEKDLKKLVEKENLNESIVYLNLSNIDQDKFVETFNNKYPYKVKLTTSYPAVVMFDDGKVVNMLQGKKDEKLTITKFKQFIDLNKIGE